MVRAARSLQFEHCVGTGLFLPCGICQHYATANAVFVQQAGQPHSDVGVHGQTSNADRMPAAGRPLKGVTYLMLSCKPSKYLLEAM